MSSKGPADARALCAPLYLLAAGLVALPALDFVTSVIPVRSGDLQWRFASMGLLSGFVLTPTLGVALAMGVAQFGGHRRGQRALAWTTLVGAGVLAPLLLLFVLDSVQLSRSVPPDTMRAFTLAAFKGIVKHAACVAMLTALGWRGLQVSRPAPATGRRPVTTVVIGG